MANNSISLVNLDFDVMKANLKTYLKSQTQFQDYDFDGSNMSVLLDILTYNTHMNAFYMNMVASEMFLDSAQLRNSVISKAKELNYTPRSARSSQAVLHVQFPQQALSSLTIPIETKFTGLNEDRSYTFTTDRNRVVYPSGGYFTVDLTVYEGSYTSDTFVIDNSIENQRFVMTNDNIDTNSLTVTVYENDTTTVFTKADTLYGVTSSSNVYFIQATEDTQYEVIFGDGVLGRTPLNNALIVTRYRVCSGEDSNGSTNFTLDDNLGSNPTITVTNVGFGGSSAETIESIRRNAPKHYQTQNRAVTTSDFKNLVLNNFDVVKAVNVYGGEDVSKTVEFGKVFVTCVTQSGSPLSLFEKQDIEAFLLDKCTVGLKPIVTNPDYLYIVLSSKVKYDSASTSDSSTDIENAASLAIKDYDEEHLTNFDIDFKTSKLEQAINGSHPSVTSNESSIVLRKDVNPELNADVYIDLDYKNPIVPGSFSSTVFLGSGKKLQYTDYNALINTLTATQTSDGKVKITNSSNTVYLKDLTTIGYETYSSAGTINYESGKISLNLIEINGFVDSTSIRFYASPSNQDISARGNDIIQIDIENLEITATTN